MIVTRSKCIKCVNSIVSVMSPEVSVLKVPLYGTFNVVTSKNIKRHKIYFTVPVLCCKLILYFVLLSICFLGSPNSQLPRYPAFDFSEQEDVHSLFPSPSVSFFSGSLFLVNLELGELYDVISFSSKKSKITTKMFISNTNFK